MRTIQFADPSDVQAFVAVVEQRGFRGAARALGTPKSTLSQRVAELEAHLGAQLLVRTTRSVALTDIGASYYREVGPALAAIRAAEATVGALQAHPSGSLRLTAPIELGQIAFGDVLGHFGARYPDVKIEVELTDRHVHLVEEGFDLAVRVGPLDDSGLIARALGTPQRLGLYASPAYLRRAGTPRAPRELTKHACLVMSGSKTSTSWSFQSGRKRETVVVEPSVVVNSYAVLRSLAAQGLGIARFPSSFIGRARRPDDVVELLSSHAGPARGVFAVYPSARTVSPGLRAMVDVLVERFAVAPWNEPA